MLALFDPIFHYRFFSVDNKFYLRDFFFNNKKVCAFKLIINHSIVNNLNTT
jgi:hypothetical protein